MAYPFNYPYAGYPATYQPPVQPQQIQNTPQQLQQQIVFCVPSLDVAKSAFVEAGKSVTFLDNNAPYCYVKTAGASPIDPANMRYFELVERSEDYVLSRGAKSENKSEESVDLSEYVKIKDFNAFREQFETIVQSVDKIRFDVDALGDKSTKKMVQKARKDADEE